MNWQTEQRPATEQKKTALRLPKERESGDKGLIGW